MTSTEKSPQARYDAANTVQVKLKLNSRTDSDILAALESQENKQGYIKRLIREELEMMNVKIDQNSDCYGEILALKDMLKQNAGYICKEFTNREIVALAVNELYDKLVAERKAGVNQRKI